MDKAQFDQIVSLLIPHMQDGNGRSALVHSALFNADVLPQIDWSGPPQSFTENLTRKLISFGEFPPGKSSVVTLLEEVRRRVGADRQRQIDLLIAELNTIPKGENKVLPPEQTALLIPFLLEIGRWAKNELSEIWRVRRKTQEQALDLSNEAQVRAEAPALLQELAIPQSSVDVERTKRLIDQQKTLIDAWKQTINLNESAVALGQMMPAPAELQKQMLSEKIVNAKQEIFALMQSIGLDIEKQPAK
jgi:hypothetical protein